MKTLLSCIFALIFLTACERTAQRPGLARTIDLQGGAMALDNDVIRIEFSNNGVLTARHGDDMFFSDVPIAPGQTVEFVERIKVDDLIGQGRGLRVHYASGRFDDIAVYDGMPFMSITFANKDDADENVSFRIDFGRGPYCGYDTGRDKYFLQSTLYTAGELEPGQKRQLTIRRIENRPLLLSSTRKSGGIADVGHEVWDIDKDLLSGQCDVKGGEDYQMRILAGKFYETEVKLSREDVDSGVKMWVEKNGPFYRVFITSPTDRRVNWEIEFKL